MCIDSEYSDTPNQMSFNPFALRRVLAILSAKGLWSSLIIVCTLCLKSLKKFLNAGQTVFQIKMNKYLYREATVDIFILPPFIVGINPERK